MKIYVEHSTILAELLYMASDGNNSYLLIGVFIEFAALSERRENIKEKSAVKQQDSAYLVSGKNKPRAFQLSSFNLRLHLRSGDQIMLSASHSTFQVQVS